MASSKTGIRILLKSQIDVISEFPLSSLSHFISFHSLFALTLLSVSCYFCSPQRTFHVPRVHLLVPSTFCQWGH